MEKIALTKDIIYLRIEYEGNLNPTTDIVVKKDNTLFIFDEDFYTMYIINSKEDLMEFLEEQDNYLGEAHTSYWFEDENNKRIEIKLNGGD
jgi:hypothetical protein